MTTHNRQLLKNPLLSIITYRAYNVPTNLHTPHTKYLKNAT